MKQTDVARRQCIDFMSKHHTAASLLVVIGELAKNNPSALAEALLYTAYRGNPDSQHGDAARRAFQLKGYKFMLRVVHDRWPAFGKMSANDKVATLKKWGIPGVETKPAGGLS